jgi:single-stranded-DNA-specific exonuclease
LVLDHHNADELSPYACIINNHTCEYPNKTLSGVGIVYKFCQYIDSLLGLQEADKLLDLVALGMIADMMDLRDCETRRLIEKGLINLHNPFIKMMVAKNEFSLKGKLTPIGVAFYIAPSVNAVSRVGTVEDK